MQPAIRAEGLAKLYQLGARQRDSYRTLRESITDAVARPWGRLAAAIRPRRNPAPADSSTPDLLWALKDVSFEVAPGEVIGIIGGNGAGKSTLLKILSRITEPTSGRVEIRGRVGSLLEVGTGFHPELTGRENIFLAGAILGMSRREIQRKFDQIVDFAGVERFLDTPAKRYSSGMYVRLAFAVAAHLDPEVLIVDEVLAVGDAEFQKKCLGKMQDISHGGRTVFLVSHNMAAVQGLCRKALLLRSGRLDRFGDAAEIVGAYLSGIPADEADLSSRACGGRRVTMTGLRVHGPERGQGVTVGREAVLEVDYQVPLEGESGAVALTVGIYDRSGRAVTYLANNSQGTPLWAFNGGGRWRCRIPRVPLAPGEYVVNVDIFEDSRLVDRVEQACRFAVEEADFYGTGRLPYYRAGTVFLDHGWQGIEIE